MRRLTALTAAVALAAVSLAGCGKKEPGIPGHDASRLIRLLRDAREQADDPQRCDELQDTVRRIAARVRALPDKTDSDVRDSLRNGVRNLASASRSQCREEKPKTNTETTPTETLPTETSPTETEPPPTEPPPTETTPTPPPTETTPTPTTPQVPTTPGTGGEGPGNGNGKKNGHKKKDKKKARGAGKKHGGKKR